MSNQPMRDSTETIVIDSTFPIYDIFTSNNLATYPDQYLLRILKNGSIESLSGYLDYGTKNFFDLLAQQHRKEDFYILAVDNLLKKNDFLQLTIELDQELISEKEFEEELEKNEHKYLIKTNVAIDHNDFKTITEILSKIDRKFSSDDVSELFSISLENITSILDCSNIVEENR